MTGPQGAAGQRGPVGQTGTQGPHGPQGVQGEAGISDLVIISASTASNSEDDKTATVLCVEEGTAAIGGGAELRDATDGVAMTASHPSGNPGEVPAGWVASASEIVSQPGDWVLRVYVVCANVN